MRFIHTSDWHLGKTLEGNSRLEEQEMFLNDFVNIVEENNIDMVIIAGDIYDTSNPPAAAEKLFYKTACRLADDGNRCVIVISGNHDNPERLSAITPLAEEMGILVFGYPLSKTNKAKYKGFEITEALEGCTKFDFKGEKVTLITLPYPSEKRLNEVIKGDTDREQQISYSKKVGDLFRTLEQNFEEGSINIATSHLFVVGGESTDSERPIELGGSLLVQKNDLPQNSQYTALGHLHKPQKASERLHAYYSGSPIQYSKSERVYSMGAKIVEVHPGQDAIIEDIYFKNYKPIEVFKCKGIEEAINICEENKDRNIWSYFEIVTDEVINQKNIKTMKSLLKDIIEIKPIINQKFEYEHVDMREKTMKELFIEYYKFRNKVEPKGELLDLFLNIVEKEGDNN